jgi:acyl-CoA synthetase (NDP forming)
VTATKLARLLSPASVAVVGASEKRVMPKVAVPPLLASGIEVHLVNPTADTAFGRPTVPTLSAIGHPVDAVLSLVSADRAVDVVTEAGRLGCGGVVVVAGGFSEAGASGRQLQDRLAQSARATGLAVIGPNCTGFVNVSNNVGLFTGTPVRLRPGGVSVISQSGYLMRAAMVAAQERNLGMRLAVSSGNEAVTGLVDYLDFLVDDPGTRVICAVIEKVRDPEPFFAVAAKARQASKPIIALKLGRTDRGREIVRSHTGALTTESWVYDVAFRQAGIILARDIDDLLDRAMFLAQLPPERWRPVRNVALLASSGGVAAVASDTFSSEGVELDPLAPLLDAIRHEVPGAPFANPLDLTGFALDPPDIAERLMETYARSEIVDAVVVTWWLGEDDERRASLLLDPLTRVGERAPAPLIMTTLESSRIGQWTSDAAARHGGIAFGRGLRGTVRGLLAMDDYVSFSSQAPTATSDVSALSKPSVVVPSEAGPMVGFDASMRLLSEHGIAVAPWVIVEDPSRLDRDQLASMGTEFVVKLADVAHRTELGAVRVGIGLEQVASVVAELAAEARARSLPASIVVQPRVQGTGEAFAGFRGRTDLGPVVVVGLGGLLVELTRTVAGRRLPVGEHDVQDMLDELGQETVFKGLRGGEPWDREALTRTVVGLVELGQRASSWVESIDLNPLICGPSGCVAVDALLLTQG